MKFFSNKNNNSIIENLLEVGTNKSLFKGLTFVQNDIAVGFNSKVIAITSLDNDDVAAAFAKSFGDVYNLNGASYLIIDANLYNPCLNKLLETKKDSSSFLELRDGESRGNLRGLFPNSRNKVVSMNKSVYPSEVYKNKSVHQIVNENMPVFDHIIIVVPSIKKHKEIILLNDILGAVLLVTIRNVTKKEDVFNAIQFCHDNKLPLAKAVVVK